jgi:hypothetical protein
LPFFGFSEKQAVCLAASGLYKRESRCAITYKYNAF